MRTYQTRLAVDDDAPLRAYAGVFSRALRGLHASRHSGSALSKPRFMREFGLTSRQYNAVKFSLDGMESSIVQLRPGRIADLQERIKAAEKKLAKLLDAKPKKRKPSKKCAGKNRLALTFEQVRAQDVRAAESLAFKIHHVRRRRADLVRRLAAFEAKAGRASASVRARSSTRSIIFARTAWTRTSPGRRRGARTAMHSFSCSAPKTRAAAVRAAS
jgi:hypothetical protein